MKSLYRTVQDGLSKFHVRPLEGQPLSRFNNLCGFISGMIRKGNSSLPDIGSGLRQDINAASKTMSAKRLNESLLRPRR